MKINKKTILLAVSAFFAFKNYAQQAPHFTQYMFNGIIQNPAHINKTDYADASLFFRRQWTGIKNSPQTMAFLMDVPFSHEKLEVGGFALQSRVGVQTKTRVNGNIVYRTPLNHNKRSILAMGTNFGIVNQRIGSFNNLTHEVDAVLNNVENSSFTLPDVSFGATLKYDKYKFGLSGTHLIPASSNTGGFSLSQHYNFTAAYTYEVDKDFSIVPSLLLKYVNGAIPVADLNTNFIFNKLYWLGASYRTGDAFTLLAGAHILDKKKAHNKIYRIGYAFDVTTNKLNRYNYGTHELMLSILFRTTNPIKCVGDTPLIMSDDDF